MQDSDNLWRHKFWSNKLIAPKKWSNFMAP